MGQVINEVGHQYGRLTVLRRAGIKGRAATWFCKCICGKNVEVRGISLRNGDTKSCGCLQKERAREAAKRTRFIDETGKQYGRLTVLHRAETQNRRTRWLCHCTCGKNVEVLGVSLRRGDTKSCGCLQKERMSLPTGEAAFNQLVLRMKAGARRRGYSWNLANAQVRKFTSRTCFYCGVEPSQRGASQAGYNGVYLYNGLDRVDNEQGYTIDNVVPSCGRCNEAKNNMTQDEFLDWISRVYKHSVSKENETFP